jgi:hypothetical protein
MDIQFEGQYDQKLYTRAIKMVITPPVRSTIIRIVVFMAALAGVAYLYFSGMQDGALGEIETNRVKLAAFFSLVLALYLVTPYLTINSTVKRLWKRPSVQRVKSGTVSTEGITYGDRLKTWDSYIRKYVFEDMVMLITNDSGMSLIQRDFFQDEMDWKRFLQMVAQYAVKARDYQVK